MAQLTGTAARPTSQTPAFVAGTLFAVAAMATVVILALALGVNVGLRGDAAAAQTGAAGTYDSRLDPIEDAYIKAAQAGAASAPRPDFKAYDATIDPQEQAYIDAAHSGSGAATLGSSSPTQGGLSHQQLVPR